MYETTDQLLAEISDHWVKDPHGNLWKLIDSFNGPLEQISDNANRVEEWRAIQDAQGTTLDFFGEDISTARPTRDDDPYRFLIRLKYLLAKAQGTIPSIVKITGTALGTNSGIKIWHTNAPRHIGIQLPWDFLQSDYIRKFLVDNLQHMLALGYWLDEIVFNAPTHVQAYIGAGSQDRWEYREPSQAIWWTGWTDKTASPKYYGYAGYSASTAVWRTKAKWWTGYSETADVGLTLGLKQLTTNTQHLKAE